MSLIDLIIPEFTQTIAPSNTAQYARIDNTSTPVFTTVPGITALPFDITPEGVPYGQYQVNFGPNYPNGANCPTFTYTTPACPQMIAVNAVQSGNNIIVNYTAPTTGPNGQPITNVAVTITGPNGSIYNATFTNGTNNSQITYPIPTGIYGNYTVAMQAGCDITTGFFGPSSPAITVPVSAPVTNPSLTGTVSIVCPNNCNGQQSGGLQFNLAAPLSADVTIQMASQYTTPTGQQQYGCSLLPAGDITGSCQATGYASFVIPAGVLQVNIPQASIRFSTGLAAFELICFCPSNPDYATIFMNTMFLHSATQPSLQISLTAIDTRITVTQI